MMNDKEIACLLEGERLVMQLRAMLAAAINEHYALLDMVACSGDAGLIEAITAHMRGWRDRLDAARDDLPSIKVH